MAFYTTMAPTSALPDHTWDYWTDISTSSKASTWTNWTPFGTTNGTITVSGTNSVEIRPDDVTWNHWTTEERIINNNSSNSFITFDTDLSSCRVYGHWVEEKREAKAKNKRENKAKLRRERAEKERQRLEQERQDRELEEERRRIEEKRIAREAAQQKAQKLLTDNLDKEQRKSFEKRGSFRVKSKSGKHYEITKSLNYNVISLDAFKRKKNQHCALLKGDVPHYDTMLAQKLMLEHKEEEFLKIANVR